jgi:serine/threonine protein phosphatase 1
MRRIAIGDIHGCFNAIKRLLEEEIKITKSDQIFLVGDIISKGPESGKTLDYLIECIEEGYNIKSVKGNHEEKVTTLFETDLDMLEQYLQSYNALDLLDKNVEKRFKFLFSLPYFISLDNWIIIHSEIDFENNPGMRDLRMIFNQSKLRPLLDDSESRLKRQVFGHHTRKLDQIIKDVENKNHRIGIDGGYIYKDFGHLIGLDLDQLFIYKV